MKKQDELILIDGHAVVFRAYHAFPETLTSPDGELVNAVYGFSRILLKVMRDLDPKYIAVAFDMEKPTFRHTTFSGYKAQRKETPTDLISQLGRVKEIVQSLNIPLFGVEGYEADDIIGTITQKMLNDQKQDSVKTVIVTGDKDAFQLIVDDKVGVYVPAHHREPAKEFGEEDVLQKMGVPPTGIVDFKALSGDASDNIPGVRGIGPKTAAQLLTVFGSVEKLYAGLKHSDKLSKEQTALLKPKLVEKLVDGYQHAVLSQKLAQIDREVPLQFHLEECEVSAYNKETATRLFLQLGFKSLLPLLPEDAFEKGVQEALF